MRHAWTSSGGIDAQLNHIAVLLSMETLESDGYDIRHRELLAETPPDHDRDRFSFDYHTALSGAREETRYPCTASPLFDSSVSAETQLHND